jgi:hypothetical protein
MPREPLLKLVIEWAEKHGDAPFHYQEAVNFVRERSQAPKENLAKNVLRGIARNPRFKRVSAGTYVYRPGK